MPTNTAGGVGHQDYSQQVQYLRKRINYNSSGIATAFTIGYLPAGASVIGGGVHIVTAFNDSGTDTLDVGFIGGTTDDNAYATLLDLSAVGFIVLDELAATTNIQQSVTTTVTCKYNGQNTNATAGAADVTIMYSLPIAN
jgi:hypothetical protein